MTHGPLLRRYRRKERVVLFLNGVPMQHGVLEVLLRRDVVGGVYGVRLHPQQVLLHRQERERWEMCPMKLLLMMMMMLLLLLLIGNSVATTT